MNITKLGSRSVVIAFEELETNLLAIYGDQRTYLCDTFLGPEPMELVKAALRANGRNQEIVVFNSHSHWDHVWGNCAFPGSLIVAQERCRERLLRHFDEEWQANSGQAMGEVVAVLPNLTFSDRLVFTDDEVEFFYSPGHTEDSASCLDLRDRVLFVGDNVEAPIPCVESPDLAGYAATLERYLGLDIDAYVAGHGRSFPRQLLEANLDYVRRLAP